MTSLSSPVAKQVLIGVNWNALQYTCQQICQYSNLLWATMRLIKCDWLPPTPPCLMYYLNLWIYIVIQVNVHTQTHWVVCSWGQSLVWMTHINQIIYSLCTQVSVSFIVDVFQLWPFEGNRLSGGVQYINLPAVSYVLKPTPTLGLTLLKTSSLTKDEETELLTNSQKNTSLNVQKALWVEYTRDS